MKEPDAYLGADIRKMALSNGDVAWALLSDTYVKRAVEEVERYLNERGKQLKKKLISPMASGYRPELDMSPELERRCRGKLLYEFDGRIALDLGIGSDRHHGGDRIVGSVSS